MNHPSEEWKVYANGSYLLREDKKRFVSRDIRFDDRSRLCEKLGGSD